MVIAPRLVIQIAVTTLINRPGRCFRRCDSGEGVLMVDSKPDNPRCNSKRPQTRQKMSRTLRRTRAIAL